MPQNIPLLQETNTEKGKRVITLPDFLMYQLEEYTCKLYGMMKKDRLFVVSKAYLEHEIIRGVKLSGVKRIRLPDLRHSHTENRKNESEGCEQMEKRL